MSAGTSKVSMPRMNSRISVARIAGRTSGRVMLRVVRIRPLPATSDASSSEGSIDRSAALISRKTSGRMSMASTQIIPGME